MIGFVFGGPCVELFGMLFSRDMQWAQWRRREKVFSEALGAAEMGSTPLPPVRPEAKGEARLGLLYLGFAFSAAKTCMF